MEISFLQMQQTDLDDVMKIESVSHIHPWTKENFSDALTSGHWAYCVRWQNTQAIEGPYLDPITLLAYFIIFPDIEELALLNITVSPHSRQLGIGRRIMEALDNLAFQQKKMRIVLEVRPSNTVALSLYQKLGYKQIGIRKNYYPENPKTGECEDAFVMTKEVLCGS